MRFRGSMGLVTLVISTLAIGGCATSQVGRARVLAEAGVSASSSLADAQAKVASSFTQSRLAENMQDAMLGIPQGKPNPLVAKIDVQLSARKAVANRLKSAYASFAALAQYDASGEFVASAGGLFDAINAAGRISGLSDVIERSVGAIGGELLSMNKVKRLNRASMALRAGLTAYKQVLEHDGPGFTSIQQHAIAAHFGAVRIMWRKGLLSSSSLLTNLVPEEGLTLQGKPEAFTNRNKMANAMVVFELDRREKEQQSAVADSSQQQHELVEQLIAKHKEFEAGGPMSLAEIQATMDQLAASIDYISTGNKGAK